MIGTNRLTLVLTGLLTMAGCEKAVPPPQAELTPAEERQQEDQLKAARQAEGKAGHNKELKGP